MELRHLEYFIAVAEELHFGHAADRLQMTQPPLSQQIQQLEKELGLPLFIRSKRHVELTEAGQVFLQESYKVLSQLQRATDMAKRAARGQIGRLVVGFVGSATFDLLPRIIRCYMETYPHIDVALTEMGTPAQIKALQNEEIDVGVLRPPTGDAILSVETIQRTHCVVVVPQQHSLAARQSVSLQDLARYPFIVTSREIWPAFYDDVIGLCRQAGFSPVVRQEVTELQTVIGLVAAGIGISIVPASSRNLHSRDVLYLDIDGVAPTVDMAVAWRHGDSSALVQGFLSVARSVSQEWRPA